MKARRPFRISDILDLKDTDSARSEMRQFLLAMAALAFIFAALGTGSVGADAFAKDIILVFCGGWCANKLVGGTDVFKSQLVSVLQAYFTGLLCCSVLMFAVGWMVFLPQEYQNLGHSLLLAATLSTNLGLALFPVGSGLRFDGLFDHLWLPALIAQCCAVLVLLQAVLGKNPQRLLTVLGAIAALSLALAMSPSPVIQMLPFGGLWAFLFGAIPFIATHRFAILKYAILIGLINLMAGILTITTSGDTLLARALVALGLAFLYVGSRNSAVSSTIVSQSQRWFGMALHTFLWAVPLTLLHSALSITDQSQSDFLMLIIPCLLFAIFSWTIWQHFEARVGSDRLIISGVLAFALFMNGLIGLSAQGFQIRFPDGAQAYIHALDSAEPVFDCPMVTDGPLAGLNVCRLGPDGPPKALVWGDHQLDTIRAGFAEAARRAQVPTLLIAQPNCIPVDGLQTRFSTAEVHSGRECDQHSAQVLQAIPHIHSIRQVTLVADWTYYTDTKGAELFQRPALRLGPMDGTPIDVTRQADYVATATQSTIHWMTERGLRVSVLRQVPAQPRFDAEMAARASVPGARMYLGMPALADAITIDVATRINAPVDTMFRRLAATGQMSYVNSWSAYCSDTRCTARGGLSSDYITSTRLSPSGALALAPILEADLKRALTHVPFRRAAGS